MTKDDASFAGDGRSVRFSASSFDGASDGRLAWQSVGGAPDAGANPTKAID